VSSASVLAVDDSIQAAATSPRASPAIAALKSSKLLAR
jgi:hypothetical protein